MRSVGLLAAVLLLSCHAAPSSSDAGYPLELTAALEAARDGRRAEAKAALESKRSGPALLIEACVHLDAGEWREASEALRLLAVEAPGSAEGRVLEAYLQIRRDRPRGALVDFLDAWNGVGRPLAGSSALLPPEAFLARRPPPSERRSGDLRSRLLALANRSDADLAWLVEELPGVDDLPLFLAMHTTLMAPKTPEALRARALPLLHERLTTFLALRPDSLQLRLALFLLGSTPDSPFSDEEAGALLRLADTPRVRVFTVAETATRFEKALGDSRAGWMRSVAFSQSVDALSPQSYSVVLRRAKVSAARANTDRRPLAEALWKIGRVLSERDTLLELNLGTAILSKAAELGGNTQWSMRAAQERGLAVGLMQAARELPLDRWPLHTMNLEAYDRQLAGERAFFALFFADRSASGAGEGGPTTPGAPGRDAAAPSP